MGEIKRYYWLRLADDFFSSKRIKKLRSLAGGDTYTIIYLKMQLKALKTDGYLYFDGLLDNFAEELALDLDEGSENVKVTIQYLLTVGLLEMSEDGREYSMPYMRQMIGSETAVAQRVRDHRKRQKALQCNTDVTEVKQLCNVEKEIEKEKEYISLYRDIVEHLNKMTGKNYKASSEKTKKLIHARLKEGFTLEDFKTVIDIKCAEWLHDEKMETYLRPETLFGTKFEGYLNQKGGKNDRRGEKGLESGMASEVPWSVFRGDFD